LGGELNIYVHRLRAIDIEIHDSSFPADCISAGILLDPTPYRFSVLEAADFKGEQALDIRKG
jgi:hypothetical protein